MSTDAYVYSSKNSDLNPRPFFSFCSRLNKFYIKVLPICVGCKLLIGKLRSMMISFECVYLRSTRAERVRTGKKRFVFFSRRGQEPLLTALNTRLVEQVSGEIFQGNIRDLRERCTFVRVNIWEKNMRGKIKGH